MAQEHSFANPGPAGLGGLAVACFCFFALLNGYVGHGAGGILAFWLMGAAVVQLAAGFIELKDHNLLGGNLMTFFGAFFCVTGAASFLGKTLYAANGIEVDARIDGWAWIACAVFITVLLPCYLKANKVFFWTVVLADLAVLMIGLIDLKIGMGFLAPIAGWLLLGVGFGAFANIAAMVINPTYGKEIVKLGAPYSK